MTTLYFSAKNALFASMEDGDEGESHPVFNIYKNQAGEMFPVTEVRHNVVADEKAAWKDQVVVAQGGQDDKFEHVASVFGHLLQELSLDDARAIVHEYTRQEAGAIPFPFRISDAASRAKLATPAAH